MVSLKIRLIIPDELLIFNNALALPSFTLISFSKSQIGLYSSDNIAILIELPAE